LAALSSQHSLLLDFTAGCSLAASVVGGVAVVATFADSDLEELPQHPDMIDLQFLKLYPQ